ncbi:hypothetical protein KHM19_25780 [Leptospira borgpetersenii]|nr:hypothetical protein KHM19_25780 [Leptospira borgpetersenii]GIM26695.1 hypothetical protein KHM25_26200 [Leptospira borgpetersenii]
MDLSEVRATFISESEELLSSTESNLLILEKDSTNEEGIHSVFRAIHTIKGTSGMFGYEPIEKFTHEVETLRLTNRTSALIRCASFLNESKICKQEVSIFCILKRSISKKEKQFPKTESSFSLNSSAS